MGFFDKMLGRKNTDTADTGAPPSGEADFATALSLQLRGEPDAALEAYQQLAGQIPDDPLAPFFAASLMAGKGMIAEAAESLRELSRRTAEAGESVSLAVTRDLTALAGEQPLLVKTSAVATEAASFGDLLKAGGFVRESAVCFEIAITLAPDNAELLYRFGDTLHDLRSYDYAESVLKEALRLAPNHWGALYTYAVLLQDLGRDEEALEYYEKAVRFNPDHARCRNNYAAALMRTNRLDEALSQCIQAAEMDPGSPFVKINLGNIYLLREEYERARASFEEAISLGGNLPLAYYGLASVERLLQSDFMRVRSLYLQAIELNPSVAEFHHALGTLLAADGDPEALEHFSAALRLNGSLKNLHRDYGMAALQLGRRGEGLEQLRAALAQNPDDAAVREILAREEQGKPA